MRADRNEPKVYFGRPGFLLQLPWPKGDMDKPYDRLTYDFTTGSGQHQVSTMLGGSRSYAVNWNALHLDNYKLIEQFWTGAMGQGPWVLIDPSAPNLLLPNQSATTQIYNDARGWATSTGAANMGTLTSNAVVAQIHRPGARRNLLWSFPVAAATTPTLKLTSAYRNWWGIPVVPGLSYAWSLWAKPDGVVDSSITMAVKVNWLDASGATLSTSTSADTPVTAWTRLSIAGVAPVGAVYASPVLSVTGSTVTTGGGIYIDEPLMEQDTVVNDWAPGTGLRPVEILSLNDSVPFAARFRKGLALTLRELTP